MTTDSTRPSSASNKLRSHQRASSLAISSIATISTSLDLHNTSIHSLSLVSRLSSANSTAPSQPTGEIATTAEQDFPVPSFRRLPAMNLLEWKQASMGCLSAILFGAIQPVYTFAMGSMISVFFLPEHDEIKKKKKQNIFASFRWIGCVSPSWVVDQNQNSTGACCHLAYQVGRVAARWMDTRFSTHKGFLIQWLYLQKGIRTGCPDAPSDDVVSHGALSSYEWLSETMVGDAAVRDRGKRLCRMIVGSDLLSLPLTIYIRMDHADIRMCCGDYPGVYALPASFALPWIGEAETLFVFP
ncbi:ABC transporter B family member 15 [Vitis vinifera]|uniref:ABC transporter B family member 15 n=1 Tax=Vitis vinifera TaxID=29760 RepID=A0A438JIG3_VITVI|nr:ABC transporter B family member 15 [Vitis vinifera]